MNTERSVRLTRPGLRGELITLVVAVFVAAFVGRALYPALVLFGPVTASVLLLAVARSLHGWKRTLTGVVALCGTGGALYQIWVPSRGDAAQTMVLFADTLDTQLGRMATQAHVKLSSASLGLWKGTTRGIATQNEQDSATADLDRTFGLWRLADHQFRQGQMEAARRSAEALLALLPHLHGDSVAYADAMHHGNIVLGRIALRNGNLPEARRHLLAAGRAPRISPFGPNMSLAQDLLLVGERTVVLEYFRQCHAIWWTDYGALAQWDADVRMRKMPYFGANLRY